MLENYLYSIKSIPVRRFHDFNSIAELLPEKQSTLSGMLVVAFKYINKSLDSF